MIDVSEKVLIVRFINRLCRHDSLLITFLVLLSVREKSFIDEINFFEDLTS
jgi:hypothetical protein